MSDINLMTIFDAARELCDMKGIDPFEPADNRYPDLTNHERYYVTLSRKYKGGAEYSAMEQQAIDKVMK